MGKIKSAAAFTASLALSVLTCTETDVGDFMRKSAFASAGLYSFSAEKSEENPAPNESDQVVEETSENQENSSSDVSAESEENTFSESTENSESDTSARGEIINLNRTETRDTEDYSLYTKHSGAILRYNYGKFSSPDCINLKSGAQVRNCTEIPNSTLEEVMNILPDFNERKDEKAPRVLIYHTHTSESFLPEADWYDADYPIRSSDCEKNMTAVGDALCKALAENGVSVIHECTAHDSPMYTGAYYRSADTLCGLLEQYDFDVIIDLHRDGIANANGSLVAPVCEVNGKAAAQFMIISCCENEYFDMPDYIENFKLACLLQNTAEEMYPCLARPVLFDYRNYNQSLSDKCLLIEVGSHGNSLEEAVYTGELLGNVIARAITQD